MNEIETVHEDTCALRIYLYIYIKQCIFNLLVCTEFLLWKRFL